MNMFAWIILFAIVLIGGIPLFKKSGRTRENKIEFVKAVAIVLLIIVLVQFANFSLFLAAITAVILSLLFDKKTYTKKRLAIYGSIVAIVVIAFYMIVKDNPQYALKLLMKNPETTSLYVAKNNEEIITYQSDVPRPLASVVKIIIAVEYAYQIENGTLSKDQPVLLDDLDRFYIKNSDGGAHPAWLDNLQDEDKIDHGKIPLHDVANGMITYSSNANTDYLIDLLGADNINYRMKELELIDHDHVQPIAGSLLALHDYKKNTNDSNWTEQIREMSDKDYNNLALTYNKKMKNGFNSAEDGINLSVKEQRIWSDRLPNAPAATYGQLLNMIRGDTLPPEVASITRDLLSWPIKMIEQYKENYQTVESKGGSTAFVLNQAKYIETFDGDQFEIVILMDDLSRWQSFMLQGHMDTFILEMVDNEDFLKEVQELLAD